MAVATLTPDETTASASPWPNVAAEESAAWLERLRGDGAERAAAIGELRALLLRAASFELRRRAATAPHLRGSDQGDIAEQCANDALVAVLAKLDQFRGESRFTTWAYKFALLEAAVKARRHAWQGRELPVEDEAWSTLADAAPAPHRRIEENELLSVLREEIEAALSDRQRIVLVAVTLNDVPIDVLAERLDTTRGALYKTLHDARRNLRAALLRRGFRIDADREEGQ
jgi:RNA polymerase sigma-70 factor (ECF subfamily)